MEVWLVTKDIHGRPIEYLVQPGRFAQAERFQSEDGLSGASIDIPNTRAFHDRTDTELDYIHALERNESLTKKTARKVVDWALDIQGTLGTSAICGTVVYEHTHRVLPTIGAVIGGFAVHEFGRRPFVGARHFFHQFKNPWSPAAQSTARTRRAILDT